MRPSGTFEQAAAKFVLENQHKRSIDDVIGRLKLLIPWIGQEKLERLHRGTLVSLQFLFELISAENHDEIE